MARMEDASYPERLAPGLLVPHYLVHCWLYYEAGHALITDAQFDRLAKRLVREWEQAKGHPDSHAVDRQVLATGAGAHQLKIPRRTIQAAKLLLEGAVRQEWGPEQVASLPDWTELERLASLTVSRQVAVAGWRAQDCRP